MKTFASVLTIILVLCVFSYLFADPEPAVKEEKEQSVKQQCPKTQMTESCLLCHIIPSFKVKEALPYKELETPNGLRLLQRKDGLVAYYLCDTIDPDEIAAVFEYLNTRKLTDKVVIEVHNPGGMVFDGWRTVNIIQKWKDKFHITTELYGMAFSAGFLIFEAGEERVVSATAELMWHETAYYEFLAKVTPSDSEDKTEMMRHLQDNANSWLAERSGGKTTKDFIDKKIKMNRIGWWFNGEEALKMGFADRLF